MREDGNHRDGIAQKLIGVPPERLQGLRMMGGGNEITFGKPVRPGDVVTLTRRLIGIEERQSRMGVLVFFVHESTYTNQHGELLAICRETNIGAR
jgi:acyl dehydratase